MAKNIQSKDFSLKETIGLAAEYAVASELCRRGFYAQLTIGHHKKADLLVESKSTFLRFSVKAKAGSTWPKVQGIWENDDWLVFVDFQGKSLNDSPDFYLLTVINWRRVINRIKLNRYKQQQCSVDKKTNTLVWPSQGNNSREWRGCEVRLPDIAEFKDRWPSS